VPSPKIVHQGRGGYVEIARRQYAIEHVEGGRFVIHVPARTPAADRAALELLVAGDPMKWALA
jgi:hypothetical protein